MRRLTVALVASFFVFTLAAQDHQVPDPTAIGHTKGKFGTCAPIGDAKEATEPSPGRSDPYLNALKNRDKAPADSDYKELKIADVIADEPDAATAGKSRRDQWTQTQRDSVSAKEEEAIELAGFLAKPPKKEGPESCNCHSATAVDYHMWLVAHEDDARDVAVVVEISPRELKAHPKWVTLMTSAANDHTLVRVRGWRTWDQEHPEQLGNTRGTLWEIHPIHEIDVADENGDWVPIDGGGGGN